MVIENIENFKAEVYEINDFLNKLKNNVNISQKEKKNKLNELDTKIKEIETKINNKINDSNSDKEKEELNLLLNTINTIKSNIKTDIANLQHEILVGKRELEGKESETREKGFFGTTLEQVKKRINNIKEKPGNLVLGGAIGLGIIMAIKKIGSRFSGNKDKEGISTDEESKKNTSEKEKTQEEKKSFWKTTWGKVLKWAGITTVAGGSAYALSKAVSGSKENTNSSSKMDQVQSTTGKIDTSKVDTRGFTPGQYPFKHIKTPYKGISAYKVDDIKLTPLIGFSQLSLKGTEGELTTLNVKDYKKHFSNPKSIGYKKNNPCNVSPFPGDIGRISSSRVADGQNHGGYKTMEDGLASFMKLMRQDRYRNKSIQGINCSGMQGVYSQNEPDSLKALRITRITHACEKLNISPFVRLNTDDKETMMAFTQQTAINETGSYFDRATLERAYNKAFG